MGPHIKLHGSPCISHTLLAPLRTVLHVASRTRRRKTCIVSSQGVRDVEIVISGSGEVALEATPEGETIEAIHPPRFRLKRPAYTYQPGRYEEDVQEYSPRELCHCSLPRPPSTSSARLPPKGSSVSTSILESSSSRASPFQRSSFYLLSRCLFLLARLHLS